jgi:tetratricopeptide (TPR) repeat protein
MFNRCKNDLLEGIKTKPNEYNLCLLKGQLHENEKNIEKAEKYYIKAIEIGPDKSLAYFKLGFIKNNMKLYDEGISLYEKALKIGIFSLKIKELIILILDMEI